MLVKTVGFRRRSEMEVFKPCRNDVLGRWWKWMILPSKYKKELRPFLAPTFDTRLTPTPLSHTHNPHPMALHTFDWLTLVVEGEATHVQKCRFRKQSLVSQGKRVSALTCAQCRGVGFQGQSLFFRFPTPIKWRFLSLAKTMSWTGDENGWFYPINKRGTNLETKLLEVSLWGTPVASLYLLLLW